MIDSNMNITPNTIDIKSGESIYEGGDSIE